MPYVQPHKTSLHPPFTCILFTAVFLQLPRYKCTRTIVNKKSHLCSFWTTLLSTQYSYNSSSRLYIRYFLFSCHVIWHVCLLLYMYALVKCLECVHLHKAFCMWCFYPFELLLPDLSAHIITTGTYIVVASVVVQQNIFWLAGGWVIAQPCPSRSLRELTIPTVEVLRPILLLWVGST